MFEIRVSSVGGQAVMEGVMMRDENSYAIVVRNVLSKEMLCVKEPSAAASKKNKFYALPVVRGVVNFVQMLSVGMKTLSKSAELCGIEDEGEPSRFDAFIADKLGNKADSFVIGFSVFLAVLLAVVLFMLLPSLIAGFFSGLTSNSLALNAIEGAIRLLIFFLYVLAISNMKDIKRVFMYHGAEHMVVHCYENEKELTIENAKLFRTLHPRCGTNYLFLVMIVSIILFSFLGFSANPFLRLLLRLLMLPLVAGVAYEVLRACARHKNLLTRIVRAPGLLMQRFTTKPPTDDMLEVAIAAFNIAMDKNITRLDGVPYSDIKDTLALN